MGLREYILGTAIYTLKGADPEGCLNRFNGEGISVWNIQRQDALSLSFTTWAGKDRQILALSEKAYCQGACIQKMGLKEDLTKLLHRPFLLFSVLSAILLSFLMEGLIWKVHIDAGDRETAGEIRYVLMDLGVGVWSKSKAADPQKLRYALLNRIPELSWVAVNPKGGKLTVLALPKEEQEEGTDSTPGNLVAVRDGVITESVVLEGMSLVKVGQSVQKGQILVSGIEDYGLYLKAVQAEGEIYGQTWHCGTLVTPSQRTEKRYTGRSWEEINLLFGRKFINLSGSSSILGGSCDKMIDTKQLSLPGCPFPLYLQRVTYREYTTQLLPMPREEAKDLLCRSWEACLLSSMVAGRVEETDSECFEKGGLYILQGESICHELLSRPMSLEPPEEGADPEWNGS